MSLNPGDTNFSYKTDITYNSYGQVETIQYPETPNPAGGTTPVRLTVRNEYDPLTGQLKKVRNNTTNELYWEMTETNAAGQITAFKLGDGLTTYNSYAPETGLLSMITTTGNMQNLVYGYDRLGNLLSRRDNIRNMTEEFGYDGLNRLTSSKITAGASTPVTANYQYDALGNIKSKPGFGDNYIYGEAVVPGPNNTLINAGPHAVTTVKQGSITQASYSYNRNGAMMSGDGRYFTYKATGQVASVSKGGAYSTFRYNPDQMRMVQTTNQGTTVYLNPDKNGNRLYDKEIVNGVTTHVHYISGGNGVIAEYRVKVSGTVVTTDTQYLHKDHLGSVDVITAKNSSGVAVERQRMSFSPFGERRSATKWSDPFAMPATGMVTRQGYTGHEEMDDLGIVQMNGRLYDARLERVLSADPYIQAPGNSQSFNRYSYVMNNPLSLIDPSGYSWKKIRGWLKVAVSAVVLYVCPYSAPLVKPLLESGANDINGTQQPDNQGPGFMFNFGINYGGSGDTQYTGSLDYYPDGNVSSGQSFTLINYNSASQSNGVNSYNSYGATAGTLPNPIDWGAVGDDVLGGVRAFGIRLLGLLSLAVPSELGDGTLKHRGRIQAQGGGLEASVPWSQDAPLTVNQGIAKLEALQGLLGRRDLELRQDSFDRALRFMNNAAAGGGIGPTKQSFAARGSRDRDIRVDIEVQAGFAFVP